VNKTKILVKCAYENCTTDDYFRDIPLIIAAENNHVDVVRVLLEGGVNVERTNIFLRTALHYGAFYGYLDVCRLLLDRGAKVNPLDKWKFTPLHLAARNGHLSAVKLLVERGAEVRLKNEEGQTASEVAGIWRMKAVEEWLDSVSRG
jgi:ankyrin repeat protein